MFPLNNSDEMISHQQVTQDLLISNYAHTSVDSTILRPSNLGQGQTSPSEQLFNSIIDEGSKKMLHREIEKQRRAEMASLHAELRSLIPLEYIKGKRSKSDQMNGALNYIERLKITISELNVRRDNLIKELNVLRAKRDSSTNGSSSKFAARSCFAVHNCAVGVEIVFSSSSNNGNGLALSRVLQLLGEKGLTLVTCVTTNVSEVLSMHTIQAEVNVEGCINLAQLQQTLNEMIPSAK